MNKKLILLAIFVIMIIAVQGIYWSNPIGFEDIRLWYDQITQLIASYPIRSAILYIMLFIITTTSGLPLSITFIGGYLFGISRGILFSTIGSFFSAVIVCALTRYFVGDWVYKRYKDKINYYTKEIEKYGLFYIVLFHVTPFTPTFLAYASTALTTITFYKIIALNVLGAFGPICLYTLVGHYLHTINSAYQLFLYLGIFGVVYAVCFISIFIIRKRWITHQK